MPHPIIEISELAQAIVDHCLLDNKQSLVSLSCTCRALEEQALSALWSEQSSLKTLIKSTLPGGIFSLSEPLPQPTSVEWNRFRRYASWMRRLFINHSDPGIPEGVLNLVSTGVSGGFVCPELRELDWKANYQTLPFHRLFFSPKLTRLSLRYLSGRQESSEYTLSIIRPVITELDTFRLRHLNLDWFIPEQANREMESVASSAILRCGPALETLGVFSRLSDAAVQHIIRLPNIVMWCTVNEPPGTQNSVPIPDTLPRLQHLGLSGRASLGWLPLLARAACRIHPAQKPHQPLNHDRTRGLDGLVAYAGVPIDAAFMSPVMAFRELTLLRLDSACSNTRGCAFNLVDDDIAEIATALPRLRDAEFGGVCSANSCRTTVISLLSLSTGCGDLEHLEIHFNTENLRRGLESVSADPRLDGLPSSRACGTFRLALSDAPCAINADDVVPVLKGFRRIFPSLTKISGKGTFWKELNSRLQEAESSNPLV